jgi:hypothetical protein
MAKRFTDTEKWKKPFIRGLQGAYKLLWLYICDDCDHAGIWQVDLDVAQIRIGEKINIEEAIKSFGDKIVIFDKGNKWFIPSFIEFQYPSGLNPENRAHNSTIILLEKYNLIDKNNKPLKSPLEGAMDMDKDMVMVKDKEQAKEKKPNLEEFLSFCKEDMVKNNLNYDSYEYSLKSKFNSWEENGWKDGNNKPIKSWKSKIRNTIPFLSPFKANLSQNGNTYQNQLEAARKAFKPQDY